MTLEPGTYEFGPGNGELLIKTGRAGAAAKAGHNLTIAVTEWSGTLEVSEDRDTRIELKADGGALEVLDGEGGVTTLTDPDKRGIEDTIDEEVLQKSEITFRSTSTEQSEPDGPIRVQGELELAGQRAPVNFELTIEDDEDEDEDAKGDDDEDAKDDDDEDGGEPQDEADDASTDDEEKPWEAKKDTRRVTGSAVLKQSDFGIKQYSTLFGTLKVADEVEVTFSGKLSQSR